MIKLFKYPANSDDLKFSLTSVHLRQRSSAVEEANLYFKYSVLGN